MVLSLVTLGVMVAMVSFCRQVTYCFCKKGESRPTLTSNSYQIVVSEDSSNVKPYMIITGL